MCCSSLKNYAIKSQDIFVWSVLTFAWLLYCFLNSWNSTHSSDYQLVTPPLLAVPTPTSPYISFFNPAFFFRLMDFDFIFHSSLFCIVSWFVDSLVSSVLTLWLYPSDRICRCPLATFRILLLGIILWSTELELILSVLTISISGGSALFSDPLCTIHVCEKKIWWSQPLLKSITTLSIQVHFQLLVFKCQAMFE